MEGWMKGKTERSQVALCHYVESNSAIIFRSFRTSSKSPPHTTGQISATRGSMCVVAV